MELPGCLTYTQGLSQTFCKLTEIILSGYLMPVTGTCCFLQYKLVSLITDLMAGEIIRLAGQGLPVHQLAPSCLIILTYDLDFFNKGRPCLWLALTVEKRGIVLYQTCQGAVDSQLSNLAFGGQLCTRH